MKLIYACRSTFCKDAWGSFNSTDSGGSYFGYPIDIANSIACEDLDIMVRTLACEDFDSTMLENDILTAYAQSSGEGIMYGNQENAFNPAVSCHSWDAAFAGVAAWGGEIHWIAKDEQRYSQYIIEGVDAMGGRPETLCVVNGRGSDGTGVYRSYSASVPQRRYLRVRELDDMFVVTTSDWVMWGDAPGNWPLEPGDEFALLPLRATSSGEIADSRRGPVEKKERFDIEPTDVVVYTTTGYEVIANRIRGSWQMTTDLNGNYLRARTWSGSDDPLDVQDLYRQVFQANQQYNAANPDTPYRARPILQIVGDGVLRVADEDTVRVGPRHFRWSEGEHGGSGDGGFSSYALMTDIDGDDIPDGPDVVIPLQDYAQAQIHADAVEDWNASGPLGNDVLLCLDDAYGGVAADWMEPRVFGEFASSYVQSRGLQLKDVLKESDYLPYEDWNETVAQMIIDGTNLVNSGIAEVWYTGLAAATSNHTQFMEGVADWTTPQRFLLFGPSCDFGDPTRALHQNGDSQILKEMFDNPGGGIVVGGIGQFNALYYHVHRRLALLMQEILPQMPEGTLLADAKYEILREFLSRYPELKDMGLGIHCVGSVAKLKSCDMTSVDGDPLTAHPDLGLTGHLAGSGASFRFSLSQNDRVNLKVYDIRGRLISTLLDKEMQQGEHSVQWEGKRIASGLYFARLQVGKVTESLKISIVK
jgi:hypothetical protein